MVGTGIRGLNEAVRVLSISSRTASCAVAGGLLPSCRLALDRASRQMDESPSQVLRRSMATEASLPNIITSIASTPAKQTEWNPISTVPVTIHNFPSLEPSALEEWSVKHLYLPLRRDLLHLAVVYEGDKTRQGTASSKTRWEVKASGRKLRPQKGTGRARVRDAASPLLRGGGKTFGPKPRDFSTKLNRKVYDVAWRTALSYRYRRGELIVCADGMDLPLPKDYTDVVEAGYMSQRLMDSYRGKYVKQVLAAHRWGREFGRTTFITTDRRKDLHEALENASTEGRALELEDVDVKDLLETARIVIERSALKEMIQAHQSDLVSKIVINGLASKGPPIGQVVVE